MTDDELMAIIAARVAPHLVVAINNLSAARAALNNALTEARRIEGDHLELTAVRGYCGALLRQVERLRVMKP